MAVMYTDALYAYALGKYHTAHGYYNQLISQAKDNYQKQLQQQATSQSCLNAKADYCRVLLENTHVLVNYVFALMKGYPTTSSEQWVHYTVFARGYAKQCTESLVLTPTECFNTIEKHLAVVLTLNQPKDSTTCSSSYKLDISSPQSHNDIQLQPFLSLASNEQLASIREYLQLLFIVLKLHHFMLYARRLTKQASIDQQNAPGTAIKTLLSLDDDDSAANSTENSTSSTLLELLLTTSEINTRIFLTKCRVTLEQTKMSLQQIGNAQLSSQASLQRVTSTIKQQQTYQTSENTLVVTSMHDSFLPWSDVLDLSFIPIYQAHLHEHAQVLAHQVIDASISPVLSLAKVICMSKLLDNVIQTNLTSSSPSSSKISPSVSEHQLVFIIQMLSHYNLWSEFSSVLVTLTQKQQTSAPLTSPSLVLNATTPVTLLDPFSKPHNTLITDRLLTAVQGAMVLSLILKHVLTIFIHFHVILRYRFPFLACSVEYNMTSSYASIVMLGQDVGMVKPYFGLQDDTSSTIVANLERIQFTSPCLISSSSTTDILTTVSSDTTSNQQYNQYRFEQRTIEQLVLNCSIAMIKFISLTLHNHQHISQSNDSATNQTLDINYTRIPWVLQVLVMTSSLYIPTLVSRHAQLGSNNVTSSGQHIAYYTTFSQRLHQLHQKSTSASSDFLDTHDASSIVTSPSMPDLEAVSISDAADSDMISFSSRISIESEPSQIEQEVPSGARSRVVPPPLPPSAKQPQPKQEYNKHAHSLFIENECMYLWSYVTSLLNSTIFSSLPFQYDKYLSIAPLINLLEIYSTSPSPSPTPSSQPTHIFNVDELDIDSIIQLYQINSQSSVLLNVSNDDIIALYGKDNQHDEQQRVYLLETNALQLPQSGDANDTNPKISAATTSLLCISHKTSTTLASQPNKVATRSTSDASVGRRVVHLSHFSSEHLQHVFKETVRRHNALTAWYNTYICTSAETFDNLLEHQVASIFSPSLFAAICTNKIALIATPSSSTTDKRASNTYSSLSLSFAAPYSPSYPLLVLCYDALLCAYSSGALAQFTQSLLFPSMRQHIISVHQNSASTAASVLQFVPSEIIKSDQCEVLQLVTRQLFAYGVFISYYTHQASISSCLDVDVIDTSLLYSNYNFTQLQLLATSLPQLLWTYTINNSIIPLFILQSLHTTNLHLLSKLSTTNTSLNSLIHLVMTTTSSQQMGLFDQNHRAESLQYESINTRQYPLGYQLPVHELTSSISLLQPILPAQNIVQKSQLVPISSSTNAAVALDNGVDLNNIADTNNDSHQAIDALMQNSWLFELSQYFHKNLVPADLFLCDEQLDDDEPSAQSAEQRQQPQSSTTLSELDVLLNYNIVSPYFDSLFGSLSTQAVLSSSTPSSVVQNYIKQCHFRPQQNNELFNLQQREIEHIIDVLSVLTYVTRVSPSLALFILKLLPGGKPEEQSTESPEATTASSSGPIIEVIDENEPDVVDESETKTEAKSPTLSTFPLLSVLLFFATSLSVDPDLSNADSTDPSATLPPIDNKAIFFQEQGLLPPSDQTAVSRQSDNLSYQEYRLTQIKLLAIDIFAQLSHDVTIKTLIAAHGIDIYALFASPDEYLIQYQTMPNDVEDIQNNTQTTKIASPQVSCIPRTSLSQTATKQMVSTNFQLSFAQFTPLCSYTSSDLVQNDTYSNSNLKITAASSSSTSASLGQAWYQRTDVFSHMFTAEDLPCEMSKYHLRASRSAHFAMHALTCVGILVASQTNTIAKPDAELSMEQMAQILSTLWHQLEYLVYFDQLLVQHRQVWVQRHYMRVMRQELETNPPSSRKNVSIDAYMKTSKPWQQFLKATQLRVPTTQYGQVLLSCILSTVNEVYRGVVESLMYLCADIRVKQAVIKFKIYLLIHAFCGGIGAHSPATLSLDIPQGVPQPDFAPQHHTVLCRNTAPEVLDLSSLKKSSQPAATAGAESSTFSTLQSTLSIGNLSPAVVKLINTYFGQQLLLDSSTRLAMLQILHHLALSSTDLRRDQEQSQTQEQLAALKMVAARGVKAAAQGQRLSPNEPGQNEQDIASLYGSDQELVPIRLFSSSYIIDCLYQIKNAYQYAFVQGLPLNVHQLVLSSVVKTVPSGSSFGVSSSPSSSSSSSSSKAASSSATTTISPSAIVGSHQLPILTVHFSNNILLPMPVFLMFIQILKTMASVAFPNDAMTKRFKQQLAVAYNIFPLLLDIVSQLRVLTTEMDRRDAAYSSSANGDVSTNETGQKQQVIYPQRYYAPHKDHSSTLMAPDSVTGGETGVMSAEQVKNMSKTLHLWCTLSFARITMHINPHYIESKVYQSIFNHVMTLALAEDTVHELTIYECLLSTTNLLVRRTEETYTFSVENEIIKSCINKLLLQQTDREENLDIITAVVELFCNYCALGVMEDFLCQHITTFDAYTKSCQRDTQSSDNDITISNNAMLLIRLLLTFATYDDRMETTIFEKNEDGMSLTPIAKTVSTLRLKSAALGCIAMICGFSPLVAACVAHTSISYHDSASASTATTTSAAASREVLAPMALMAIYRSCDEPDDHDDDDDSTQRTTAGKRPTRQDLKVRCQAALQYIHQVASLIQQGRPLSKDSW